MDDLLIAEDASNRDIIQGLKSAGIIKKTAKDSKFDVDGEREFTLYIEYRGIPVCELRRNN